MTLRINLHGDYLADWSGVPAWAVGVAVNECGEIVAFSKKPELTKRCWCLFNGMERSMGLGKLFDYFEHPIEIANWQDTWRERPGQEEKE